MKYFIYKIVNKYNKNDFYVGSTKDLKMRIIQHKHKCKNPKFKIHLFINENGGFNNFYFYIIDIIECEQGKQIITEDKYITQLNPPLNMYKAYIENKEEYYKQYKKQYNEAYKEQRKQYDEKNKEKIKEQKKQYRQANKEKIKEYFKQYNEANKEKIKEQRKQYKQRKKQQLI